MPLPALAVPLAIGAVQAIPKVAAAITQKRQANRLQLQDSTPAAFREQMGNLRQAANSAQMPGMAAAENRLNQNLASGLAQASRAGTSSSQVLGTLAALDQNRQQGQQQLATQGLQYQDTARQRLNQGLTTQANYQMRDLDQFNKSKAALIQSSNQNLMNGIDGLASAAATAYATTGAEGLAGEAALVGADNPLAALSPRLRTPAAPKLPATLPRYTGR
ncbi:hypothetical protein [Hymenobacter koreensis]|uniref:Uncharacterized protein n=1 Tax=Hymenobacter koreensis TaxID=1084523 RepID=A0ABP8JK90_9BACT